MRVAPVTPLSVDRQDAVASWLKQQVLLGGLGFAALMALESLFLPQPAVAPRMPTAVVLLLAQATLLGIWLANSWRWLPMRLLVVTSWIAIQAFVVDHRTSPTFAAWIGILIVFVSAAAVSQLGWRLSAVRRRASRWRSLWPTQYTTGWLLGFIAGTAVAIRLIMEVELPLGRLMVIAAHALIGAAIYQSTVHRDLRLRWTDWAWYLGMCLLGGWIVQTSAQHPRGWGWYLIAGHVLICLAAKWVVYAWRRPQPSS